MSGKRFRIPIAKPGEVKIAYGRPSRHDDPDICAAWGGKGADKSDARTFMHAFTERRMAPAFPSLNYEERPSLVEELEARGYDITTLRFTIQKKVEP
ncbi:Transposase [Sphingomonas zeae]|jgi:hypothetical protein